jgi:hypothetical protein
MSEERVIEKQGNVIYGRFSERCELFAQYRYRSLNSTHGPRSFEQFERGLDRLTTDLITAIKARNEDIQHGNTIPRRD